MYSLISKTISSTIKSVTKQAVMKSSQKAVVVTASKLALSGATAAGAAYVNKRIKESEAQKIADKAAESVVAHEENPEVEIMTEDQIRVASKKAQTKANVSSGVVIGAGSVLQTLVDAGFKLI